MKSKERLFTALSSVVCEHWPKMGGGKRKLDLEKTEEEAPARKRANLDHLYPEEQLMRRKLKSRRPDCPGQEESSDIGNLSLKYNPILQKLSDLRLWQ